MIAVVIAMVAATAAVALVVPALGSEIQVGVAPGDVTIYGPSTGVSGVTGVTVTPGVTGVTGVTDTSPVPQCTLPNTTADPCLAISQTTGFQVKIGGTPSITVIPRNGWIVAWTAKLGAPSAADVTFFDNSEGGAAEAGISILKPGKHLEYALEAQSPMVPLQPYFGQTAEFPLAQALQVKKGEIVALTVPTWAPMLALYNATGARYGKFVSWRSSRQKANKGCTKPTSQTAQQSLNTSVEYACLYQQVRITYSALEVSTP